MQKNLVDIFISEKSSFFPEESLHTIEDIMLQLPDELYESIYSYRFKNPKTMLLISIFLGGVERLLMQEYFLGLIKILTNSLLIWYVADWFIIKKKTKQYNEKIFYSMVSSYRHIPEIEYMNILKDSLKNEKR